MQVDYNGFQLKEAWKKINVIDNEISDRYYAFSSEIGYLTSDIGDVGTGMRASIFVHLPGLVLTDQMQHLVNAVQQIGVNIRHIYGENNRALNHIFEISNQHTLGIDEFEEVCRLGDIVKAIVKQENMARQLFLEHNKVQFWDKIGRIYGVLRSCYSMTSEEALEMLSWMRLATDLGIFDKKIRPDFDRLMLEIQSGNLAILYGRELSSEERNYIRAEHIHILFREIPEPYFVKR
jgi:protein arginine kinase